MHLGTYNGLGFMDKDGLRVVAPESYMNATASELVARTGGCGPGKFGDKCVPDRMYGENVFLACQIHDWMYWVGVTLEDKQIADFVFLMNLVLIVGTDGWFGLFRLWRCGTYYYSVAKAGNKSFLVGKAGRQTIN